MEKVKRSLVVSTRSKKFDAEWRKNLTETDPVPSEIFSHSSVALRFHYFLSVSLKMVSGKQHDIFSTSCDQCISQQGWP